MSQVEEKPTFGYWLVRCGPRGNLNRYILAYSGADVQHKLYYELGYYPGDWFPVKHSLGLDFPNVPYYIDGDFKLS